MTGEKQDKGKVSRDDKQPRWRLTYVTGLKFSYHVDTVRDVDTDYRK